MFRTEIMDNLYKIYEVAAETLRGNMEVLQICSLFGQNLLDIFIQKPSFKHTENV